MNRSLYMEYFEEIALSPECLIDTPWWKRYVNEIIGIDKKEKLTLSSTIVIL